MNKRGEYMFTGLQARNGELSIYYASLVCSKDIEEKAHNHFRAYKLRGEWFSSKPSSLLDNYIEAQEEEYE